jgi:hypothetical protein
MGKVTSSIDETGDISVPMSGMPDPKIAHLRHRTKTSGGGKPAIFNLWNICLAGTAFG